MLTCWSCSLQPLALLSCSSVLWLALAEIEGGEKNNSNFRNLTKLKIKLWTEWSGYHCGCRDDAAHSSLTRTQFESLLWCKELPVAALEAGQATQKQNGLTLGWAIFLIRSISESYITSLYRMIRGSRYASSSFKGMSRRKGTLLCT